MKLESLLNSLPAWAKDTKLNVQLALSESSSLGLHLSQIHNIALVTAVALKDQALAQVLQTSFEYSAEQLAAIQGAATLMAMNNVYYRFTHLVGDTEFSQLPAHLRMNFMANPGVSRMEFELLCLAVSILNSCEACIQAHTKALLKAGISKQGIQSVARITAIINALSTALAVKL